MTNTKDVIELNGKRYHALTGAFLGNEAAPAAHSTRTQATTHTNPRHSSLRHAATVQKPARPHTARATRHLPAHRPQPTRTLMRHAVPAPQAAVAKPQIKPQAPVQPTTVVSNSPVKPKLTVSSVDPSRSQRAANVDRSHLIKHFQAKHFQTSEFLPASKPAASVAAKPIAKPAPLSKPAVAAHKPVAAPAKPLAKQAPTTDFMTPKYNATHSAVKPQPATTQPRRTAQPQPVQRSLRRPTPVQAVAKPAPKPRPVASDIDEQDIFEKALAMATSHEQKPPKQSVLKAAKRRKRVRRLVSLAAGMAVFLLLAGFIAYQNKASIQLQLASAKAGFAASDPVYKPEGYSLGKLSYEPNAVTTEYQNADKEKSFTIVQKKSNWDSQTLLENFVATESGDYQGYESNGRTIYLYGDGKATWVDGGVWYQVNAAGILPTDQLVKVAASM